MKQYVCDYCTKHIRRPAVELKGVMGYTSGGILLPASVSEQHFCGTVCFWAWIKRQMMLEGEEDTQIQILNSLLSDSKAEEGG